MFKSEAVFNVVAALTIAVLEGVFVVAIIISDGDSKLAESAEAMNGGWYAIGWSAYFFMTLLMSVCRTQTRRFCNIDGNGFSDLLACFFVYFQAAHQMWEESTGLDEGDEESNPTRP